MPVAIVGSARSGTSMVARLLSIGGVSLGDEKELYGASQYNPTGHWEHLKLQDISLRLLAHLGGCYDAPPTLADGWELDSSLDGFYAEVESVVESSFPAQGLWGWKDPQVTFLIPFWRRALPGLRFVVCVRNPLEVAGSWSHQRDTMIRPLVFAHWHISYLTIFAQTSPDERLVVFYDRFFPDYRPALKRMLGFVGLDDIAAGSEQESQIAKFMDRGLKHHNSTVEDLENERSMPPITRRFYVDLVDDGAGEEIARQVAERDEIFGFQLPKCVLMHRLFELESSNQQLQQILESTTHRAAAAFCSVLIKMRFDRVSGLFRSRNGPSGG